MKNPRFVHCVFPMLFPMKNIHLLEKILPGTGHTVKNRDFYVIIFIEFMKFLTVVAGIWRV